MSSMGKRAFVIPILLALTGFRGPAVNNLPRQRRRVSGDCEHQRLDHRVAAIPPEGQLQLLRLCAVPQL
jgi:hypothetical protein